MGPRNKFILHRLICRHVVRKFLEFCYLLLLTANGVLPGGSGTTSTHNTQINTRHKNNTQYSKKYIQHTKSQILWKTKDNCHVHKNTLLVSNPNQMSHIYASRFCLFRIQFDFIPLPTPMSFKWYFASDLPNETLLACFHFYARHFTSPIFFFLKWSQ